MTCNAHTPGQPSTADEAWYWPKRVLCIVRPWTGLYGMEWRLMSDLLTVDKGGKESVEFVN